MQGILDSITKADWWFTTILVAILANIVANFLYDWLKVWIVGRWASALIWALQILIYALFIISTYNLPIIKETTAFQLQAMAWLAALGGLWEARHLRGYGLTLVFTTLATSSLMIFEAGFSRAVTTGDLRWFAYQYFFAVVVAFGICAMVSFWLYFWAGRRKRTWK